MLLLLSIHKALQTQKSEHNGQESKINPAGQNQATPSTSQAKAKLSKLILTRFRGDVTKWVSFWDSFKSAVHENPEISSVNKFNYLNSLLEGPASRAIQGLALTEDNYNSAIKILQERFGRPQQIILAQPGWVTKDSKLFRN